MRHVKVYVEGPSDRLAMQELLRDLLQRLREKGVIVSFISLEGKPNLLKKVPLRALNDLSYDSGTLVIVLPDLYPPDVVLKHRTYQELHDALKTELKKAMRQKGITNPGLLERFYVFCFKHDLEALLLAAEHELAIHLGCRKLHRTWVLPVEEQDHNKPPKHIVEALFKAQKKQYVDTIDAPGILRAADYRSIAQACPQCFKPFVELLESLA